MLQKIHHPHTVQFLGACTHQQPYMIVTEYLPGGSMSDLFKQINAGKGGVPTLRRGVELALGCARGMLYLHSRSYAPCPSGVAALQALSCFPMPLCYLGSPSRRHDLCVKSPP